MGTSGVSSLRVILIKTPIITPRDDLLDLLTAYARPQLAPGDLLAISSKIVSICQGRLLRPEEAPPSAVALWMSRFIDQDGSLSSPHALQAVIWEVGFWRIGLAFLIGGASHLLGRRGDFYRLAGYTARVIDDVSGTLPPFDKHIILPPHRPERVVADIRSRLGAASLIVDANDLGKADILAATPGIDCEGLLATLCRNPWGNGDQQTPIMILRPGPPPAATGGSAPGSVPQATFRTATGRRPPA